MSTEVIQAGPTKAFFISMLVRDIGLIPAIIDLVDNSVDGARRLRPKETPPSPDHDSTHDAPATPRFHGLWVRIRLDEKTFEISDNCGGIPWIVARDYAFRFGRPDEAPETPNSIGQFGIGMKRSLFKLGTEFTVDSKTVTEAFVLNVDVDDWKLDPSWTFPNVDHERRDTSQDAAGTLIRVLQLHESASENFGQSKFRNELVERLSLKHQATLNDGLSITLNTIPVDVDIQTLFSTNELTPARIIEEVDSDSKRPVNVEIFAGIDRSSPSEAGWYIYCNGRLILGPDQTSITGWGEGRGKTIPKYHNQFARFRGYAFFESDDVEKLPWTTTKEGIDADHRVYRAIRPKLIELTRPVIDFLNALDGEKDHPDRVDLERMVLSAERQKGATPLHQIPASPRFTSPERAPVPKAEVTNAIQYARPAIQVAKVKKRLKVKSNREVGEGTFDYFYRAEFGNDDE
ncbi:MULTISPECIES: ATP-binding protein [Mycobacteroides]|uniref:ATP-binding protein n=1 Tax=Mycobacteroides TaxID=670516 RepID=UPI0008A8D320|nr:MULTISPECIES: ATP-binding protein [Mycobacteroides]MBF9351914.1 ATP-binding protein [Mycobacteroides chelonae]